jgi:hypothetical protein
MELSTACVRENHEKVFQVAGIRRVSFFAIVVFAMIYAYFASVPEFAQQYKVAGRSAFPCQPTPQAREVTVSRNHGMHALPRRQSRGTQRHRHSGRCTLRATQYF